MIDDEVTMSRESLRGLIRAASEGAWDRAVANMVYEDGTPVELAHNINPYRAASE